MAEIQHCQDFFPPYSPQHWLVAVHSCTIYLEDLNYTTWHLAKEVLKRANTRTSDQMTESWKSVIIYLRGDNLSFSLLLVPFEELRLQNHSS